MAFEKASFRKSVAQLPTTLEPDTLYFVRASTGFDLYLTNKAGVLVAYKMNSAAAGNDKTVQYNNSGYLGGASNVLIDSDNLVIKDISAIPASSNDGVKLFSLLENGKSKLSNVLPNGESFSFQRSFVDSKFISCQALGSASTVLVTSGTSSFSTSGTASAVAIAATKIGSIRKVKYSSGAAGSISGIYEPRLDFWRGNAAGLGGFHGKIRFNVDENPIVNNTRLFAGMANTTAALSNVNPLTVTNSFGVCQAENLPNDNNLYFFIVGTSTTVNIVDTGFTLDSAHYYELEIYAPPFSNMIYMQLMNKITGTVANVVFNSANFPANQFPSDSAFLAMRLWRGNNGLLVNTNLTFSDFFMETGA